MINVVYHAFLTGQWQTIVLEQLNRLSSSGLYQAADQIWMTINKNGNDEKEIKKTLKEFSKLRLEFHEQNFAEYPGIKKVKELGETTDSHIFYFHTKGVSNNWKTYQTKEVSEEKIYNVKLWRECLEYFLIDKWKDCNNLLKTHDTVGVSCNDGWYWGNFWWATSAHIRKTEAVGLWDRWSYEAWLNKGINSCSNFEFYHMGVDPYLTPLLPEYYKTELKTDIYKNQKIVIKKAIYGTPSFEIDEGYNTMQADTVVDVTSIVTELIKKDDSKKIHFGVNNDTMGGDPLWGQKKFLMIECYPEQYPEKTFKVASREGWALHFEF